MLDFWHSEKSVVLLVQRDYHWHRKNAKKLLRDLPNRMRAIYCLHPLELQPLKKDDMPDWIQNRESVKPIMYNYIRNMNIFRKNTAISLGNTDYGEYLPALRRTLEIYDNAELKETVQWMIDRIEQRERQV